LDAGSREWKPVFGASIYVNPRQRDDDGDGARSAASHVGMHVIRNIWVIVT